MGFKLQPLKEGAPRKVLNGEMTSAVSGVYRMGPVQPRGIKHTRDLPWILHNVPSKVHADWMWGGGS